MKLGRFAIQTAAALAGAFALTTVAPAQGRMPAVPPDRMAPPHHGNARGASVEANELIRIVRESTERFRDVTVAQAEGYQLLFGCVSGPDAGAMGLHFVNLSLVGDGVLDPTRPEIVIYEPLSNGRLRLTGADFLVFSDAWHAKNAATPELMGQLLHLFESPNRFGLPAFYTLHVWAWKDNPNGAFVNWHPKVNCDHYNAQPF